MIVVVKHFIGICNTRDTETTYTVGQNANFIHVQTTTPDTLEYITAERWWHLTIVVWQNRNNRREPFTLELKYFRLTHSIDDVRKDRYWFWQSGNGNICTKSMSQLHNVRNTVGRALKVTEIDRSRGNMKNHTRNALDRKWTIHNRQISSF